MARRTVAKPKADKKPAYTEQEKEAMREAASMQRFAAKQEKESETVAELRAYLDKTKHSWQYGRPMTEQEMVAWDEKEAADKAACRERMEAYAAIPISPIIQVSALILAMYGWKGLEDND